MKKMMINDFVDFLERKIKNIFKDYEINIEGKYIILTIKKIDKEFPIVTFKGLLNLRLLNEGIYSYYYDLSKKQMITIDYEKINTINQAIFNNGKRSLKEIAEILNASDNTIYQAANKIRIIDDKNRKNTYIINGKDKLKTFNYEKNKLILRLFKNLNRDIIDFFKNDDNFDGLELK